jgi:O-succinylbenzoic acid--CoA ligase
VRVLDDSGKPCEPGETGNILAAGPGLFRHYRNDPKKTALALNEGWLVTGDIGSLDEAGRLHVLARRSDLIISGGENILPAEIEAALVQHPQIADAVVLPLAHPEWGQVPGAVIVCNLRAQPAPDAILEFLRQRLAAYKLPKEFRFVDSLPTLSTGKIDYSALRKLFTDQTPK